VLHSQPPHDVDPGWRTAHKAAVSRPPLPLEPSSYASAPRCHLDDPKLLDGSAVCRRMGFPTGSRYYHPALCESRPIEKKPLESNKSVNVTNHIPISPVL